MEESILKSRRSSLIRTYKWKGLAIILLGFAAYIALSFAGFYLAYFLYQTG